MRKTLFTPGCTELAGNHTDHQHGRILASGVDLGLHASYEANDSRFFCVRSEGFEPLWDRGRFLVPLSHLF